MPAPTKYNWDPTTGTLTATSYARVMTCRVGVTYSSRKSDSSPARVAAIFMTSGDPRIEIVREGPRGQGVVRATSFFNSYAVDVVRVEKPPKPAPPVRRGVTVEAIAMVDMRDELAAIRALLERLVTAWEAPTLPHVPNAGPTLNGART